LFQADKGITRPVSQLRITPDDSGESRSPAERHDPDVSALEAGSSLSETRNRVLLGPLGQDLVDNSLQELLNLSAKLLPFHLRQCSHSPG